MATPLRVPRQYEEGLARIRDLNDESVQALSAALQEIPATIDPYSLTSAVADAMADVVLASDVEEIVAAILFLYSIRDTSGSSASDIAEGIAVGMERVVSRELRSSPEHRGPFQARLVELLSVDPLSVIARAGNLSLENEHTLRFTRVVTDMRPVFDQEDPKARPRAAVIVHTLRISYLADNQIQDFFVALDNDGISELLEQLERANSKVESLKGVLETAQVPYIGTD